MKNNNLELNLITNSQEKSKEPKEIVLFQHIDRTFSIPLWLPLLGVFLGLLGDIFYFFYKIKYKIFPKH